MQNRLCAVLGGSGSAAFNTLPVAELCVNFAKKNRQLKLQQQQGQHEQPQAEEQQQKPINVCYLGTATYDAPDAKEKQTIRFTELGCKITEAAVAWPQNTKPIEEIRKTVLDSDIVLCSGGNTLYSIRRWQQIGLDAVIREAAANQVILAGGSFGAIWVFDGGHSDSADPATFRPKLESSNNTNVEAQSEKAPEANAPAAPWKYLRCSALGILPGLCCPHHDRTQSNGVPRYIDFDDMLRRHKGERGICIDHWACLVVDRGEYEVFAVPGKEGSVVPGKQPPEQQEEVQSRAASAFRTDVDHDPPHGVPGVWIKNVVKNGDDYCVLAACIQPKGNLSDILKAPSSIEPEKEEEDRVFGQNPI